MLQDNHTFWIFTFSQKHNKSKNHSQFPKQTPFAHSLCFQRQWPGSRHLPNPEEQRSPTHWLATVNSIKMLKIWRWIAQIVDCDWRRCVLWKFLFSFFFQRNKDMYFICVFVILWDCLHLTQLICACIHVDYYTKIGFRSLSLIATTNL